MKKRNILAVMIGLVAASTSAYEITPASESVLTESQFKSQNGAPSVSFKEETDCDKNCDKYLNLGSYQFTFNDDAKMVTEARYRGKSFAIVRQMHVKKDGKSSSRQDYHFASSDGLSQFRVAKNICTYPVATGISLDGRWVCLHDDKIEIHSLNDSKTIKLPENVEADTGAINNNLAGTLSIALVDADSKQLYYANLYNLERKGDEAWESMPTFMHKRSDRQGVVATYPSNREHGVVAIYEFVNSFNKGVNLYHFDGDDSNYRVITNSDADNWGFEPEVFDIGKRYVVTGKQGFNNDKKSYFINNNELNNTEVFVNDNSQAAVVEIMAGYGVQANNWEAWQSVGDDVETNYRIDDSLLHSVYVQARLKDTQLTMKYLTNRADELNMEGGEESVDILTGLVDFNGFFEGADTLRLKVDWNKTNGVATYKSDNDNFCLEQGCQVSTAFESEYLNIETLVLSEGGRYMGLSYSNFAMPSAIGVQTDSGHLIGAAFDEDYEQRKLMFIAGLDAAAYAGRYEADYKGFYLTPTLGIGVTQHVYSDEALNLALDGDKRDVGGEYAFTMTGTLDFGYIYQRRWQEAKGLGFSVQSGIRAKFDWVTDGFLLPLSEDDLNIAYSRQDLWWGPYIQFNAIF